MLKESIKIKENIKNINPLFLALYSNHNSKRTSIYEDSYGDRYHYIKEGYIDSHEIILASTENGDCLEVLIECQETDLMPFDLDDFDENYAEEEFDDFIWGVIESAEADWTEIDSTYYYYVSLDLNKNNNTFEENINFLHNQIKLLYKRHSINLKNISRKYKEYSKTYQKTIKVKNKVDKF